jgi:hypothetical protein
MAVSFPKDLPAEAKKDRDYMRSVSPALSGGCIHILSNLAWKAMKGLLNGGCKVDSLPSVEVELDKFLRQVFQSSSLDAETASLVCAFLDACSDLLAFMVGTTECPLVERTHEEYESKVDELFSVCKTLFETMDTMDVPVLHLSVLQQMAINVLKEVPTRLFVESWVGSRGHSYKFSSLCIVFEREIAVARWIISRISTAHP